MKSYWILLEDGDYWPTGRPLWVAVGICMAMGGIGVERRGRMVWRNPEPGVNRKYFGSEIQKGFMK